MQNSTQFFDGFGRKVDLTFDHKISKNCGLLPFVQRLKDAGFFKDLLNYVAPTFPQNRRSGFIKHKSEDMFIQRLLSLIVGKEDLNDEANLRDDPAFIAAFGHRYLASCPTLCRFEKSIGEATLKAINDFLLRTYFRYNASRRYIIIDVDNTPVETFGCQEGRKFNGHYDCNCYLPLIAFIDGYPVGVFNGIIDGRKRMEEVFEPMIKALRKQNPRAVILLRADSGFNSTAIIDLCEKNDCYYLIGLAPNKTLEKLMDSWDSEFTDMIHRAPEKGGSLLRHYGEVQDYQAKSWHGPRRVIARDFYNIELNEWDTRFIQTNIPRENDGKCGKWWRWTAIELYNLVYCRRGCDEQWNQEFKAQAFGSRVSSSRYITNSYRMMLGALCMLAFRLVRSLFFKKGTPWFSSTLRRFREHFVCCPGIIKESSRTIKVKLGIPLKYLDDHKSFWKCLPT